MTTTDTVPEFAQLGYGITGIGEKHAIVAVDERVRALVDAGWAVYVEDVDEPVQTAPPTEDSEIGAAVADSAKAKADAAATAYQDLTVAELRDAIEARNKDREDDAQLTATGRKADLIGVLVDDDRVHAGSE